MRDFTFLHMADLHLGSPFRGLSVDDPDTARRFAQAIRDAVSALVTRAVDERVDFVVIAGDVYDREWKDASVGLFFNREMVRLTQADIPVFLVKGNHDADSVVTRSVQLPDGVMTFGAAKATTHVLPALGVAIHGQSYRDRAAPDNLARLYPAAKPGHFNIGVLHTSLGGSAEHGDYAPCSPEDLVAKGYDYWALGHIHKPQVVRRDAPPIVYPGNVQGRSVRETGPRGAMLVRVRDGGVELEPWTADRVRWAVAEVSVDGIESFDTEAPSLVEKAVRAVVADAGARPTALRVHLTGRTVEHGRMVAEEDEVRALVAAAAARVSPDVWLEKVKLRTAPPASGPSLVPDLPGELDLDALLDAVASDEAFRGSLDADRAQLLGKLPPAPQDGNADDEFAREAVLREARALLSARLGST